ncbi:MAG: CapA family protein [Lachnospiraceae bacterium]|nr:CapA family protein [Lachnospiraceae bacterium]
MGEIKITFTGDIMCKKEFVEAAYNKGIFKFDSMLIGMREFLSHSNYVIGNLETPIAGEEFGFTVEKYIFNAPIEFAKSVKDAGVDFVATANNHCLDRGIEGLIQTNKNLDLLGFEHVGTRNNPDDPANKIINIGHVKVGMLAYTYGTNADENKYWLKKEDLYHVNMSQNQELHFKLWRRMYLSKYKIIRRCYRIIAILMGQKNLGCPADRKEFDFKQKKSIAKEITRLKRAGAEMFIMNWHAGGQYNMEPASRVKKSVKYLKKLGVDTIIVNHEHCVQKGDFSDAKNGNVVVYCLGNFLGGGWRILSSI